MTLDVALPTTTPVPAPPSSLRERRRERRRRVEQDLRSAQAASLHHVRAVLAGAAAVVEAGWVQGGWYDHRGTLSRSAHAASLVGGPVDGACLVGAIVAAGGGLSSAATQPVRRAIELAWHTLHVDAGQPVRWCPAPAVRVAHVRELTRWNDAAGRTAGEVGALLHAAARRPV